NSLRDRLIRRRNKFKSTIFNVAFHKWCLLFPLAKCTALICDVKSYTFKGQLQITKISVNEEFMKPKTVCGVELKN
ncbi:hypothetical protein CRM22_002646, partial [Opisthorchis felineus]